MIPLRDAFDVAAFGGKAVALGEALRAGLPVPDGFALAASWVDQVRTGHSAALEKLRSVVPSLQQRVAVRSSAVGEDSAGASFAGQHDTVLDVEPEIDAIVNAVRQVWESGRTESALAYRQRLGIPGAPQVGIVVQRMVESISAGVLFSRDPMTGEDVRVIEAAWGLGEAVVAGLVTPDRFRIARTGAVLERTPGYKDLLIRRSPGGGTEQVDVNEDRAQALCLDDAQLLALNQLAARCETVYGGEQDLEWAFDGANLFLLQRRPITVARGR
ncbi:MAG TPA: PEP/pyruvate-binding domain-containing protein [Vicinamibacterales bacterium]